MNKLAFNFLMLIILASCQPHSFKKESKYNASKDIIISKSASFKQFNASNFLDSISYSFLETNSHCYVAEVTDVFISHDTLLIFDRKLSSIITFDLFGKFIKRVLPSDWRNLGEILSVSSYNNYIYVSFNKTNEIYVHNFSGTFINKLQMHHYKYIATQLSPNTFCEYIPSYCISTNNNYFFNIRNQDGQIVSQQYSQRNNQEFINKVFPVFFFQSHNQLHVFSSELSRVFIVDSNMVYPEYHFWESEQKELESFKENSFEIFNLCESNNHLFIQAVLQKQLFNFVISKDSLVSLNALPNYQSSKSLIFGIYNDIDDVYPVWPVFNLGNNRFARSVLSIDVINYQNIEKKLNKMKEKNQTLIKKITSRKPIENPIIIIYNFRDNE